MREQGDPIGVIDENVREERMKQLADYQVRYFLNVMMIDFLQENVKAVKKTLIAGLAKINVNI